MNDKPAWPHKEALAIAEALKADLEPFCERIIIAGSLRREKPTVHDAEILLIPKIADGPPIELFGERPKVDMAEFHIDSLLTSGVLAKRPSKIGVFTWGAKNKLAVHVASGLPVDFFSTTPDCWWNALVCRTGGKDSNLLITTTAQKRGWSFEAYGSGFKSLRGDDHHRTTSESDVFEFLGLPCLAPWQRK